MVRCPPAIDACRPHGADDGEFTLRHYAGEVRYAAGGFLRKSRDELQPELIALLATSTDDLVRASDRLGERAVAQLEDARLRLGRRPRSWSQDPNGRR